VTEPHATEHGEREPNGAPWLASSPHRTGPIGLWAGFLAPLPLRDAIGMVRRLEDSGVETIWLQEWGGVDPFIRAGLYLQVTERMTVALGVANAHARDAAAMVAAAATLESDFAGRFLLGMGVSHAPLVEGRGHDAARPIPFMRGYLDEMRAAASDRPMPPVVLGALGPEMLRLAGQRASGAHSYFTPVAHTAAAREILGPKAWQSPTQMICDTTRPDWRARAVRYLGMCLGLANYTNSLRRFGFTDEDLAGPSDRLVDALIVPDADDQIGARVRAHREAGADHVVLQLVPPASARDVVAYVERNADSWASLVEREASR
jgi:probable F420-dependent oxidoreductase